MAARTGETARRGHHERPPGHGVRSLPTWPSRGLTDQSPGTAISQDNLSFKVPTPSAVAADLVVRSHTAAWP
eukprot:13075314-Heterocapsa_arctica.AAC.1